MQALKITLAILSGAVLTAVTFPFRWLCPVVPLLLLSIPNAWLSALLFAAWPLLLNYLLARSLCRYAGGWWFVVGSALAHALMAESSMSALLNGGLGGHCPSCDKAWIFRAAVLPALIGQGFALWSQRGHSGLDSPRRVFIEVSLSGGDER